MTPASLFLKTILICHLVMTSAITPFSWRATHNLTCFHSGCFNIIFFLNVSNLLLAKKRHNNEKLTLKQHLAVKVVLCNGLKFSSLHDV